MDGQLYLFEKCKSYKDRKISINDFRVLQRSLKLPEKIIEQLTVDTQGRVSYDEFVHVYNNYFDDSSDYHPPARPSTRPQGGRGAPADTDPRGQNEFTRTHRSDGKSKSRLGHYDDQYRVKKPATRSVIESHKSEGSICSEEEEAPGPGMPLYEPPPSSSRGARCKHCAMQSRRIDELEEDLQAARKDRRRLENSNHSIRNDFQAYYKKASELAAENEKLRSRLYMDDYRGDPSVSDLQYEELKRSKRHLEEKLAHGENMIMGLQKEVHKLQEDVARLKRDRSRLHNKNRDIEKELWCAQDEVQDLSIQLLQEQKHSSATTTTRADKTSQRFNGIGSLRKTIHCIPRYDDDLDVGRGRKSGSSRPIQRISSAGAELSGADNSQLEPVRDEGMARPSAQRARSHKSVKSEDSDGFGLTAVELTEDKNFSTVFTVLGHEVSKTALPETVSDEIRNAMVRSLENCHSVQEVIRLMVSYGCSPIGNKLQGLQVKNEHLQKKLEKTVAEKQRLQLSFQEAKELEEMWYGRCQQLESNEGYWRSSLYYCQKALETSELVVEMRSIPEAHRQPYQAQHFPTFDTGSFSEGSSRSPDHLGRRHSVMMRARTLLQALDSDQELQDLYACHSQDPAASSSLSTNWHPELSQNTTSGVSGISSLSSVDGELSSEELERLRIYRHIMQGFIGRMSCMVSLEPLEHTKLPTPTVGPDGHRGDTCSPVVEIENATHAEELASIREEKAELVSRIYMMEQNQRQLELELSQKDLQNGALTKSIAHLQQQVREEKRKRKSVKSRAGSGKKEEMVSYDGSSHANELASELKEQMEREKELTKQYDDLYGFISDHVAKSKENHDQLLEFIHDLKCANNALVEAYEKSKLKQKMEKKRMQQEYSRAVLSNHGNP